MLVKIPVIRDMFAIRALAAYQDDDGRIDRSMSSYLTAQ